MMASYTAATAATFFACAALFLATVVHSLHGEWSDGGVCNAVTAATGCALSAGAAWACATYALENHLSGGGWALAVVGALIGPTLALFALFAAIRFPARR